MDADLCIRIALSKRGSWGVSYIVNTIAKTSGAHLGVDASERRIYDSKA